MEERFSGDSAAPSPPPSCFQSSVQGRAHCVFYLIKVRDNGEILRQTRFLYFHLTILAGPFSRSLSAFLCRMFAKAKRRHGPNVHNGITFGKFYIYSQSKVAKTDLRIP
jgi:hypothetical protein